LRYSATNNISSSVASVLIIFARLEITCMLPLIYPLELSIRSIDGELYDPPCLLKGFNSMLRIGQYLGTIMSSIVILNSIPLFFALSLHLPNTILLNESPIIACLFFWFSCLLIFCRSLFLGIDQYFFSYSDLLKPDHFLMACERLAQSLEQKWFSLLRKWDVFSDLSFPQNLQLKTVIFAIFCSLKMSLLIKLTHLQYTNFAYKHQGVA